MQNHVVFAENVLTAASQHLTLAGEAANTAAWHKQVPRPRVRNSLQIKN